VTARPSAAPLQARVQVPGAALAYELSGPPAAPVLVLAHGLGADLRIWDANLEGLCRDFRVLRFDLRGHGKSSTPPGAYGLHALAQDTIGLIDYLQLGKVDFVGIDIGARIGLQLAARYPNRLRRLVAWDPAWQPVGRPDAGRMDAVLPQLLAQWLSPSYREAHPEEVERLRQMLRQTRPEGWIGCAASLAAAAQVVADGRRVPTLVLGRDADAFERARALVNSARYQSLPGQTHLAHVEQAEIFNDKVQCFLCEEALAWNEQRKEIQ
jgi:3-oxoadipate enol-lactonase